MDKNLYVFEIDYYSEIGQAEYMGGIWAINQKNSGKISRKFNLLLGKLVQQYSMDKMYRRFSKSEPCL